MGKEHKLISRRADANRKVRRDALREQLKSKAYLKQIHKLLDSEQWESGRVPEYRAKLDAYFRLLGKTLPDVKAVEFSGEGGGPATIVIERVLVEPADRTKG